MPVLMRRLKVGRPVTSPDFEIGDKKMATIIVECDACGTKNKIEDSKAQTARCGRCRNPLLDAVQEQLGLFDDDEDEDEDEDEDAAGASQPLGKIFAGGTLPHGTKFTGAQPTAADVMMDLFGASGLNTLCKIPCKDCGRMFIGPVTQTLCANCE